MPEVNYAPDPRATTAALLSRNFGGEVWYNRAPTPPTNRRKPALSYTAAGAVSVWDIVSGSWVTISAGSSSSSVPSEIGSSSEPSLALDYFDDESVGALASLTHGLGWGSNNGVVSGASIVNATMADGRIHKRLSLNNGYIGRKMPWGAFWNRIVVVLAVRINGGVNISNTNGYIGVCTGTTNMVDSANTTNFAGIRWGDGTGTSTFTTGGKINYFDVPTFRGATRRVNTTTDRGGLSSGHAISADQGYLSHIAMEISRPVFATDATGVNYSIAEASTNNVIVMFSHEKDIVRAMLQWVELTTTLLGGGYISSTAGASGVTATPFSFDQSTGVLDTINIYWPQTSPLEIAALGVRKIF